MPAYIVICADPLNPAKPDPAFEAEATAAQTAGFEQLLLDHDALEIRLDAERALRRARMGAQGRAIYRGWMLRAEAYGAVYEHLLSKGIRLLTSPQEYCFGHHAPESYPHIARWAAQSTWLLKERLDDPAALAEALAPFGTAPLVIKDWVKSQAQGYWKEACLIPNAADRDRARQIVDRFCEITGEITGGIVFRRSHELERVGSKTAEYRAFVLGGRVVGCWPRFEGMSEPPPKNLLDEIAAALSSPFASIDVARKSDGGWLLIEVGDGQVSSFPTNAPLEEIFRALFDTLK